MAERKPPSWDDIRGLIERVDEICRESERTRSQAEHSMKQRPVWPDRHRNPRHPDEGNDSPDV
jgi:hypothetical protein